MVALLFCMRIMNTIFRITKQNAYIQGGKYYDKRRILKHGLE
jgi:hypothetical protein